MQIANTLRWFYRETMKPEQIHLTDTLWVKLAWSDNGKINGIEFFNLKEDKKSSVNSKYFSRIIKSAKSLWKVLDENRITPFQKRVYEAAYAVPAGKTATYGEIAKKIGKPKASRAVGQALRRNPFPFIIPCHRVVSSQGIGGFMGEDSTKSSEIKTKKILLQFEAGTSAPL